MLLDYEYAAKSMVARRNYRTSQNVRYTYSTT